MAENPLCKKTDGRHLLIDAFIHSRQWTKLVSSFAHPYSGPYKGHIRIKKFKRYFAYGEVA